MSTDTRELDAIKNAPNPGAAAGAWWAFALRDPNFDNGDDSTAGAMAQNLAQILSEGNPQEASSLEIFAGKLASKVNEALARAGDWGISVRVDYHPDIMLSEAADEANLTIPMMAWPWKTNMSVTASRVSVRAGYGADSEVIWGE